MGRASSIAVALVVCFGAAVSHAQFTTVINVPPAVAPAVIDSNTQLNLYAGGQLSGFEAGPFGGNATNVEVNVYGATGGVGIAASHGSTINIYDSPPFLVSAYTGSTVNVHGGSGSVVMHGETTLNLFGGSIAGSTQEFGDVNMSGGSIGDALLMYGNFAISGGTVGQTFQLDTGSAQISGGTFGDGARFFGTVDVYGGEFRVNGALVAGLNSVGNTAQVSLPSDALFSGVLGNGTPFSFWNNTGFAAGDRMPTVTLHRTNLPATGPAVVNVPADLAPVGLRTGQSLHLTAGGALGVNFTSLAGSSMTIDGGTIGANFEAVGTQVTINGGTVGDGFETFSGTVATIQGATFSGTVNAHSGSQINIAGGSIASSVTSYVGSTVNVTGGSIGGVLAVAGTGNVSGGNVGGSISSSGTLKLSGGTSGDGFSVSANHPLTIEGEDFRINDVPIAGLANVGSQSQVNLATGAILTGTLADGTPFLFSSLQGDSIANGTMTLKHVALPAPAATISVPSDSAPLGVRSGQTLTVANSGVLADNFAAGHGSHVQVTGGVVGKNFEASSAIVDVTGGTIGDNADFANGAQLNMSGGSIGTTNVFSGGAANVSGGTTGSILVGSGGTVNMSGGSVGDNDRLFCICAAAGGSAINLSGGASSMVQTVSGSQLRVYGADFRVDGVPLAGLAQIGDTKPLNINSGSVLAGTLADGTPFVMSNGPSENYAWLEDAIANGTLMLVQSAVPAAIPVTFNVPAMPAPRGAHSGQQVDLSFGGALPDHFSAGYGSVVNISGGTVGADFEASDATVNISGGTIGEGLDALRGTTMNITGGSIGKYFEAHADSRVNISGGNFEDYTEIRAGSIANISGGTFAFRFYVLGGTANISGGTFGTDVEVKSYSTGPGVGVINITGGTFAGSVASSAGSGQINILGGSLNNTGPLGIGGETSIVGGTIGRVRANSSYLNVAGGQIQQFQVSGTSTVNLFGTQFLINGAPIAGLTTGTPFAVSDRTNILTGTLMDGSPVTIDLTNLSANSSFTITALASFLAGDFNRDGSVDGADYVVWRKSLGQTSANGLGADGNFNGRIDQTDFLVWRQNVGHTMGAAAMAQMQVPEPLSGVLCVLGSLFALITRRPRG